MTLIAAEPQLFVTDIDRAVDYYVGRLGFRLAFSHGEPAFYAHVVRDGARLNLRHADGPVFDPRFREAEGDVLSATITVDDAEALFAEFEGAGVAFHQRLKTEDWGARTFMVADPDGNLIAFAG
ncbi:VOC family protein [Brevundimonas sp.]|uniref:VOC family protein n=1 Tax=Brevundimonas sp. TaxID=1871086 RepID=UPI002D53C83C|nr:VOC family protein [Brevundimonas sp.]HYC75528.1 VOC family protein [Brevundimonas sp.]